jgi:hypothetical protein
MVQYIWVARLKISRAVAHKISTEHGLQAVEVRDAVQCVRGLPFLWDDEPERGRRAIVETIIRGHRVAIVLYPTNDPLGDTYNLGSAYRIP